jgi:hypothetical protein
MKEMGEEMAHERCPQAVNGWGKLIPFLWYIIGIYIYI